jgi:hypothetical protein
MVVLPSVKSYNSANFKQPQMKNTTLLTLVALGAISACTTTTGVIPIGVDTYMIGTTGKSPGGFSGTEAKALAFQEAQKFCTDKRRKVQVVNTQQADMRFGVNATAELQFMCLTDGDRELVRPKLERTPDQVIQVRGQASSVDSPSALKSKDLYSELLKLKDLKKRGLLSSAEFEQQKKALLESK